MNKLTLIKSENFGNVTCDFYNDSKAEIWMTREQIGQALEYAEPQKAIDNLHARNAERLDGFSVTLKLRAADGKFYNTTVYSARGVYEICRWSRQPKADAFYDFVYEILEALRTGQAAIMPKKQGKDYEILRMEAETRARNAKVREANLYRHLANDFRDILSNVAVEQLVGLSAKAAAGQMVLAPPKVDKTYSASEVGKMLGLSGNMVGRIANLHGVKTAEYGIRVLDKSPHSLKQVESWRYNDRGVARLRELTEDEQ